MKTWLFRLLFVAILTWSTGCGRTIEIKPTLQSLAANSPVPQTSTPKPKSTTTLIEQTQPAATRTLRPTNTPRPEISWSDAFPITTLQGIGGKWSPTENVFLYWWSERDKNGLYTAAGPEFQPQALVRDEAFGDFLWSPDGKSILYEADTLQLGARIFFMDANGENTKIIKSKAAGGNYLWLKGWLDQEHLIFSSYWGGGHESIAVVNIRTEEAAKVSALIHGGDLFPAQNGFIPATTTIAVPDVHQLLVISEKLPSTTLGDGELIGGNVAVLPENQSVPRQDTSSTFQDWMPDSSQILVSWAHFDIHTWDILDRDLILWDVERQSLRLIAPDGRSGKFSPDGKLLAYLTEGPAQLSEDRTPQKREQNTTDNTGDHIQLLDMASGKVLMSLPVSTEDDNDLFDPQGSTTSKAQFSPDGRYLAFFSPGEVQVDSNGWPFQVESPDTSQTRLNVLDLLEKKLVWSAASSAQAGFSWSPTSRLLIFQNNTFNWQLFDLMYMQLTSITTRFGKYVGEPGWSFDGQYLSFVRCVPLGDNTCKRTIHIFNVTLTQ